MGECTESVDESRWGKEPAAGEGDRVSNILFEGYIQLMTI